MIVRKIRGKNAISKIILPKFEVDMLQQAGIPLVKYVKEQLAIIGKKRRWVWLYKRKSNHGKV
jgi:hypothetical protein